MTAPAVDVASMSTEERVEQFYAFAIHLARHFCRSRRVPDRLWDDVESAALLGLLQSAQRWEPNRASFMTFSHRRIVGQMLDCLRQSSHTRSGRPPRVTFELAPSDDLPESRESLDGGFDEVDDRLTAEAELARILRMAASEVLRVHPRADVDRLRRIVARRADGALCAEVAAEEGVTESRISQVVREVREAYEESERFYQAVCWDVSYETAA